MQHTFKCRVCLKDKDRNQMRRSSKGRVLHHCHDCKGFYRCIHCNHVKPAKEFKTHAHHARQTSDLKFEDGERLRIAVCYACDYKLNKPRYDRYDKKVGATHTIGAIIMQSMSNWKSTTTRLGFKFDLTRDYLLDLWNKQDGRCFYTGETIETLRGKSRWTSASLDRVNPKLGYSIGNVIWTTRLTNTSKSNRTAEEFVEFCCKVADFCAT